MPHFVKNNTMAIVLLLSLCVTSLSAYTEKIRIYSGWNLKGTTFEIKDISSLTSNPHVKSLFAHRNGTWLSGSSVGAIKAGEGFWVNASQNFTLEVQVKNGTSNAPSTSGDMPTPPSTPQASPTPSATSETTKYQERLLSKINRAKSWEHWKDWGKDWWQDCKDSDTWDCDSSSANASKSDIVYNLTKGWNLKGTSVLFKINHVFNNACVEKIRLYRSGRYYDYKPSDSKLIRSDEGFWVVAKQDCTLKYAN